jgi:hypothetical protein
MNLPSNRVISSLEGNAVRGSVVDPKFLLFLSDPDSAWELISDSDADPALALTSNPASELIRIVYEKYIRVSFSFP